MLVFAPDPAVLRQPPAPVGPDSTRRCRDGGERQLPAGLRSSACSWRCSSSTASTPPGRSARRRSTRAARRRAASCRRSGCPASSVRSSCWRSSCRSRTSARRSRRARRSASRSRHDHGRTSSRPSAAGSRSARSTWSSILVAVYVCTLAIQGATTRLMFSMGRDRRPAARRRVGPRQPDASRPRPTPPSRSASWPRSRSSSPDRSAAIYLAIAAPRARSTSATSCATSASCAPGGRAGRTRAPGSSSGSWGTIINILALVWGGAHGHQHRPLDATRPVR